MSKRGSRPRSGDFRPVGSVLDQVLAALRLEDRFQAARSTEEWGEVVGPEIVQRTRPVGVRDGELLVEVHGAVWMGHLAVLRREILEELNRRLPEEARLRSIRLVPMRFKEEIVESKP